MYRVIFLLFLFSVQFNGQDFSVGNFTGTLIQNRVGDTYRISKDTNIKGSAYYNDEMIISKIGNLDKNYPVKYNAFTDEMESVQNGNEISIFKNQQFTPITFLATNEIFELLDYYDKKDSKKFGYLKVLRANGNKKIYEKIEVIFVKGKTANSAYENEIQDQLKLLPSKFYITSESGKTVEIPTKVKDFLELFPSKSLQLKEFLKQKTINIKNIQDLIQTLKII